MAVELPDELVPVLGAIGVTWPNVDEDELSRAARELRRVAADLADQHADAAREVQRMLAVNASEALDAFETLWDGVSGAHLQDLGKGISVLADAVSVCADVVGRAKRAVFGEVEAFAAAHEPASHAGADNDAGADASADTEKDSAETRKAVQNVLDQAVDRIERELGEALADPILGRLGPAADHLGGLLLGDVRDGGRIASILGGGSAR